MKKEFYKQLEKDGYHNKNIRKFRPLLKGLKIVLTEIYDKPEFARFHMVDESILRIKDEKMYYFNKNGLYYAELRKSAKNKKNLVYLSFFDKLKIYELRNLDEETSIDPESFCDFGILPDFANQYYLDDLKESNKNYIEIIDKEMIKSKKRAKKLAKKL